MEHLLKMLLAVQPPWKSLFFEEQDFMEPDSCLWWGGGMSQGNSVFYDGWPPDSLCLIGLFPPPINHPTRTY